ncbi:MAG: hypothetical protein ACPIOQ_48510, partial [Promethearchaeia archaeon]
MHGAHGLTHKSTYVALLSMVELTRIISSERVLPLSLLFLLPSLTTFSISPLANDSQEMEKALVPLAEIDGAWAEKVIAQAKKTSVPRGHFVSSTALRRPSDGFLLIEDSARISPMLHNAIAARGILNPRACISDSALSLISGGEQGDQVNHATIYHHSRDCLLPSLLREWWDRCRRKRALLVPVMRLFNRRRVREGL